MLAAAWRGGDREKVFTFMEGTGICQSGLTIAPTIMKVNTLSNVATLSPFSLA